MNYRSGAAAAVQQQQQQPWLVCFTVTIAIWMGSSCATTTTTYAFLQRYAEAAVVTVYGTGVLLYLLYVAAFTTTTTTTTMDSTVARLSPRTKTSSATTTTTTTTTTSPTTTLPYNGTYKLVRNDGFADFLAIHGIPWALRRAADQARPTHRITLLNNSLLTIQIQGIIESQTTYVLGQATETSIRGRLFCDVCECTETGLFCRKEALDEDALYDLTVRRDWDGPDRVVMTSTAVDRKRRRTRRNDGSSSSSENGGDDEEFLPDIKCVQYFERVE